MEKQDRILIVDALRGFALLGIILIHFVEHFELFKETEVNYFFSLETDQWVMETIMYLISGKAYSIFALMFGFSLFIQIDRKEKQGIDFRAQFAWRLVLLLMIGFIHSLVYRGDILHIYALLGLPLVFLYKANSKVLLVLLLLLAIQIPILYQLILSFLDPSYTYVQDWGGNTFSESNSIFASGSFLDVVKINFWKGRYFVWAWTYYTGRSVQLVALFIIGLLLGRKGYFENLALYKSQIKMLLTGSVFLIVVLHFISVGIAGSELTELQKELASTLFTSYANLAYTSTIVLLFILAYLTFHKLRVFGSFAIYGKMSLTNYVSQAIFGVIFFYGFGFGMYKYMGATWSLICGILFFALQVVISKVWIKKFHYGPLEWLWRALTYMDFSIHFRKSEPQTQLS